MLRLRYEYSIYVAVGDEAVSISVQLVEQDEDLVLGELADFEVLTQHIVQVVDIEAASVLLNTVEEFVAIGNVEVLPHSQLSTSAVEVSLHLHHVHKSLNQDCGQRVSRHRGYDLGSLSICDRSSFLVIHHFDLIGKLHIVLSIRILIAHVREIEDIATLSPITTPEGTVDISHIIDTAVVSPAD